MDTPTRRKAVAIRYRQGEDDAPVVVARGQGHIAEQILELAEQYDIPMYEDADLVEVLSTIDIGHHIPPELYQAIAEVLAFVYRLNNRLPEPGGAGGQKTKSP